MALIWRENMSVANNSIDHDHKYMVCYVNTVMLALQKPEEKEILLTSLSQLYSYAEEHFSREEHIQQMIKYPDYVKHKIEHKKLLHDLNDLQKKIKDEYNNEEIDEKYHEIVSFLKHWLVDHVLNTDMLLKPYLVKYKRNSFHVIK